MLVNAKGSVFIKSSCTCIARVGDEAGVAITQAGVALITYSVFSLDSKGTRTVVPGHDGASVSVTNAVFDDMQTDQRWEKDSTGYNFRHTIDISINAAFATVGQYCVEYLITPYPSGQRSVLRFLIVAK